MRQVLLSSSFHRDRYQNTSRSSNWPTVKQLVSCRTCIFFFNMDHLKVCTEFVTILLVLCLSFLATRQVRSQLPDQGSNSDPPALEGQVLTTGPPGTSSDLGFEMRSFCHQSLGFSSLCHRPLHNIHRTGAPC